MKNLKNNFFMIFAMVVAVVLLSACNPSSNTVEANYVKIIDAIWTVEPVNTGCALKFENLKLEVVNNESYVGGKVVIDWAWKTEDPGFDIPPTKGKPEIIFAWDGRSQSTGYTFQGTKTIIVKLTIFAWDRVQDERSWTINLTSL